jgi:hypothetical protein
MMFVVTGNGQNGPVRREYASGKAAFLDATTLIDQGTNQVRLQDPTGNAYGPTALSVVFDARGNFDPPVA